mgnify:FL=1
MWDARYAEPDLVWSREPTWFLPPLVERMEPGRALDLACGEGRNAIWLAKQGWEVTGADFSSVAIEKASALSEGLDIKWVIGDATTFTSDGEFDLVKLFYLHLPEKQLDAAFERAIAAVKPGGTLFGVGHALRNLTDGYGGPPVPEILWTHVAMTAAVEGLEIVELGERDRPVADAEAVAVDLVIHATKPSG